MSDATGLMAYVGNTHVSLCGCKLEEFQSIYIATVKCNCTIYSLFEDECTI